MRTANFTAAAYNRETKAQNDPLSELTKFHPRQVHVFNSSTRVGKLSLRFVNYDEEAHRGLSGKAMYLRIESLWGLKQNTIHKHICTLICVWVLSDQNHMGK